MAVLALATPLVSANQPVSPDIDSALTYLAGQQQPDGSFASGNPLATPFQTAGRVADAIQNITASSDVFSSARGFLTAQTVTTVEERARRLLVAESPADAAAILAGQNADGGFGSEPGFASNVLDTALALVALRHNGVPVGRAVSDLSIPAGTSSTVTLEIPVDANAIEILVTEITGSVELRIVEGREPTPADPGFLITQPNTFIRLPDDGLPVVPGTNFFQFSSPGGATVSYEIDYFTPTEDTTTLTGATSFLLSGQNADGGWGFLAGDEASSLYLTYWASRALSGITMTPDVAPFVLSRQLPLSGFGDSGIANTFDTAVAVRTLAEVMGHPTIVTPNAVAFLEGQQAVNGGFEDDPFRTAWAVDALLASRAPLAPVITGNGGAGPGEEFITDLGTVMLHGFAPVGATGISVDDPTAIVVFDETTGEFWITVNLSEGANEFNISATNVDGIMGAATTFTVTRDSTLLAQDLQLDAGFNMIGLRLEPANSLGAIDLLDFLGPDAQEIQRLDPVTGLFEAASRAGGGFQGTNFALFGLDSLILVATAPASARVVGQPAAATTVDLLAGVNSLTIPNPPVDLDAFALLALIGDDTVVSALQRFDDVTGAFVTAAYDGGSAAGSNFPIETEAAYLVHMQMDVLGFTLPAGVVAEIQITSPADGATVTSTPVLVSGTVSGVEPLTVTVNGIPATLGSGTFNASVPLVEGPNLLVASVTDDAGSNASDSITVTLTPVDYTLSRPDSISDSRMFNVGANLPIASIGVWGYDIPYGLSFSPEQLTYWPSTGDMLAPYTISTTADATIGIHTFQIEYVFYDAADAVLASHVLEFTVEILP
jgi:hypothetical protein